MKIIVTKKIGKTDYVFEFEGTDLHDVITNSKKLSFTSVKNCGICGCENLYLDAHEAQGYKYTTIKCADQECKASLTFGKRKDDPEVYFLRKDDTGNYDWKTYTV